MITGPEHFALSVQDLDRSIEFYRDILGLQVLRVLEFPSESGLGEVVDMPGCVARIGHLKRGGIMLELFEYEQPRGRPIPPEQKQADSGYIHIGFASTNVRSDYQRLSEQGVRFFGEPIELRPKVWIVYFYGPDGEVCELRETPEAGET